MEAFRVRIIKPDGSISVLDKTFSQICEMLRELPNETRAAFWDRQETVLPDGSSVVFVKEV